MRIVVERTISHVEQVIRFSQAELATLRKAAEIADRARVLARTVVPDFEDDSMDTSLAMIGCSVEDIAEGVPLTLEYAPAWG